MVKAFLVTTVKNEGPNILEWVAYHRLIGFTEIHVYQNDSTDETQKTLRTLERIGAIHYFKNPSPQRQWQNRAYRRASNSTEYTESDWCMALDGDEFLNIKTGDGTLVALFKALGNEIDQICVNWCLFGCSNHQELSPDLIIERFTKAERQDAILTQPRGVKTLFRTDKFKRPGIHRAKVPLTDNIRTVNGSGLKEHEFRTIGWRSWDPLQRQICQVNHYIVRDLSSFLLKSARGSASHPDRDVSLNYWKTKNHNDAEDITIQRWVDPVKAEMRRLDELSNGRLSFLRKNSLKLWREKLSELEKNQDVQSLKSSLCES